MSESSRKALVVPIVLEKHNNATSLSIVRVDGYQVVVNTAAWEGRDKAVWLEPETTVNTNLPIFSFLKREGRDKEVITAKRLRGEWSQGLLVPAPSGFEVGDDCWAALELEHYEPAEPTESLKVGDCAPAPSHWANLSRYDVENYLKYGRLFTTLDRITILEKLNGSNQSCVYSGEAYHVKSRNFWKKSGETACDFWRALEENEPLKKYLRDNPDHLVQGEMIGKVKGFLYGLNNKVEFRAFDIRKPNYHYMDATEFLDVCDRYSIKTPRVFESNALHSRELIESYVEGEQENNPKGYREGVVIKPTVERFERRLNGRLALKYVSNTYLEKKGRG